MLQILSHTLFMRDTTFTIQVFHNVKIKVKGSAFKTMKMLEKGENT